MDQRSDVSDILRSWLVGQADTGLTWLDQTVKGLAAGAPDRALFAAFAAVPRQVGRDDLPACALHSSVHQSSLHPVVWTRDQAARIMLLLAWPHDAGFMSALDRLFGAADLAELVCLYQALSLLPFPERHAAHAAEGVRSNMLPVFQAIAIGNPYPSTWFDDGAWNQMVVKAVFVGCSLHGIIGLDQRANPALARILVDYARERRAAGRVVTPDLWRPVGPFVEGELMLNEVRHALNYPCETQRRDVASALAAHTHFGPTSN